MASAAIAIERAVPAGPARGRSFARWCLRNPITTFGFALVIVIGLLGVFAPLIAPYAPKELNAKSILKPPSSDHLFGTGLFGEDIFSKVLFGARYDFVIGLGAVAIGLAVGSSVGAIAGFTAGKT